MQACYIYLGKGRRKKKTTANESLYFRLLYLANHVNTSHAKQPFGQVALAIGFRRKWITKPNRSFLMSRRWNHWRMNHLMALIRGHRFPLKRWHDFVTKTL